MPNQTKNNHTLLYAILAILGVLLVVYVFREMRRCNTYSTSPMLDPPGGPTQPPPSGPSSPLSNLRQAIINKYKSIRGRLPTFTEIKAELSKLQARRNPTNPVTTPPAQQSEVFMVIDRNILPGPDSDAVCASFGASVATVADVQAAADAGASWCAAGTVADDSKYAYWPNQQLDCSPIGLNSQGINQGAGYAPATTGVNCYGIRPSQGTANVMAFNGYPDQNRWSEYN